MKYAKMILAGILALALTACSDTNTAEETTLLSETSSETIVTEETTTATTIEVGVESEVPIISDDVFVHTTEEVEETTIPSYLAEFLATATTAETEETVYLTDDVPLATFSISKNGYREYVTLMSDEEVFVEPNEFDAILLNESVEVLKTNERFADFLNWEEHNQLAAPGHPPFVMDGYLNDDNTAKPQLKWVLETDVDCDTVNEYFIAISTAPYFTEVGGTNEYLLFKDSTGNIEVLHQTCGILLDEVYDFVGLCRCVSVVVGTNGETSGSFLYHKGKDGLEGINNGYGFIGDTETSRIYFLDYRYDDYVKCLVLNSITNQLESYFVPKEEFMAFYMAFS